MSHVTVDLRSVSHLSAALIRVLRLRARHVSRSHFQKPSMIKQSLTFICGTTVYTLRPSRQAGSWYPLRTCGEVGDLVEIDIAL
jgi:hypothetical protein